MRTITVLALVATIVSLNACDGKSTKNLNVDVLNARNIQCPAGSELEFRAWGKGGLMAICQIAHGPVVMAEGGRIAVEGRYEMGSKAGTWVWRGPEGNVLRSEEH